MTFNREDWRELNKRQGKETLNGERPNLQYLVQAQVKQENLTGDQYWDIYLSYLQEVFERITPQANQIRDRLCDPKVVDPNAIMEAKLALADINGQIRMIEAILGLPKAIMESGDKAKERLEGFG